MIWVLRSFVSAMRALVPFLVSLQTRDRGVNLTHVAGAVKAIRRISRGRVVAPGPGSLAREDDLRPNERPGLRRGLQLNFPDPDEAPFRPLQATAAGRQRRARRPPPLGGPGAAAGGGG